MMLPFGSTTMMRVSALCLLTVLAACGDGRQDAPPATPGTPTPSSTAPDATAPSVAPVPIVAASSLPKLGPTLFGLDLDLEGGSGGRITTEALRHDGPLIVSMFYASCSYACPTLIRDLVAIDARLTPAARARTQVLLVTLDPARDTPTVLSGLATAHHTPNTRWTFARARSEDATRELAAALGITYRRLPDGNFNHSSIMLALDRDGVPRARIDGLGQDASAFIGALEALAHE